MKRSVIHVNRNVMDANRKHGRLDPPLTVKQGRTNRKGHEVILRDPVTGIELARLSHCPYHPLDCGAKVYLSTELLVEVIPELQDHPDP